MIRIIRLDNARDDFGCYVSGRAAIAFRGTLDECIAWRREQA